MLSENEIKILDFLKRRKESTSQEIAEGTGLPLSSVFSIIATLESKGIVKVISEETRKVVRLTDEGKLRTEQGLPEDRLVTLLNGRPLKIQELRNALGKDFEIGFGWARRKGLITLENDTVIPKVSQYVSPEYTALKDLQAGKEPTGEVLEILLRRKLVEVKEEKMLRVQLLREVETRPAELYVTHEMLTTGSWREYEFKPYNVEANPPFFPIGKTHYFRDFIEKVKDLMVGLGFVEVSGDFVETEFFNFDMLFQPQDHPAREIHDSFVIEGKGNLPGSDLVRKVKEVHEKWWRYSWSEDNARRLVLRSQTTAVTARVLSGAPKRIRAFTIGKVFRPDSIDATHLIEFHQMDGLVIEEDFTFRDLLSTLRDIFQGLGVKQVKFKPGYFPFTEPSVEVYGFIEGLGWVEMAGAGLLRKEVTEPAGVFSPAGAWGIGIDRLAMLFLGVKDIRDLYSLDIEYLRSRRVI
ncbi:MULTISPECIES: phenylalanine--tRNA ligase subunit alpha [Metallosphaera]|uniref:Phenylalanine--tRNA ligase alpha subunit n=3 Tax=Metallosphaera TaxID=41980 RepID=SYFA_METS5|nr:MULTISPECIES: phenylalanine--tRNA ligase subunit alpha [Metallosphaera]A4YIL1.1 RecName: Full=Phenylalanine--tRNA ligase alpha subunit; AltName: Full=Phenylalanyl-tRNA synthetase alpha subunit; Short=PheRS [Metallosphaera sedula DSM 5348]ABP96263.1 phenylalanyl-tRNA synthetase, alpha subunit [Metallosphaera sedula DSM 5348]AIM28246.1 phenylalanyl-tRNA synthetase, alpha subunit [Metallosphaera sedula]AKV75053.1 phenylalanyl-tRNA synthetase subunit alpha [Metallosphaera sedula]AKV77292.1 phen